MRLAIFPEIKLAPTELDVLHGLLTNPTLRKYLHKLAYENASDIALGEPAQDESAESYLRRVARVKGRLEVLETLLSIEPASI